MIPKSKAPRLTGDEFSREFKDFVELCLIKDPAQRATTKELLNHRFLRSAHHHGRDRGVGRLRELIDRLEAYQEKKHQRGGRLLKDPMHKFEPSDLTSTMSSVAGSQWQFDTLNTDGQKSRAVSEAESDDDDDDFTLSSLPSDLFPPPRDGYATIRGGPRPTAELNQAFESTIKDHPQNRRMSLLTTADDPTPDLEEDTMSFSEGDITSESSASTTPSSQQEDGPLTLSSEQDQPTVKRFDTIRASMSSVGHLIDSVSPSTHIEGSNISTSAATHHESAHASDVLQKVVLPLLSSRLEVTSRTPTDEPLPRRSSLF